VKEKLLDDKQREQALETSHETNESRYQTTPYRWFVLFVTGMCSCMALYVQFSYVPIVK